MSDAAQLSGFPLSNELSAKELAEFERLYKSCCAAELGFSCAEFCLLLADLVRSSTGAGSSRRDRDAFLAGLRLNDLVLARACARGNEHAWEQFLLLYRDKLRRFAVGIARDESVARELADSLHADLFGTRQREDGHRISKLESYTGRGSLEGWLRTVLAQDYVNRYRRQRVFVSFDETIRIESQPVCNTNCSEREYAKLSHVTDIALAALPADARFLLAAYYLDNRTLAEIGRTLKLHESSISRRLEKIISGLRKRIVKELIRAGLSKSAANEMLTMDVRDLGVDVRNRLAQERRDASFTEEILRP